MKEMLSTINLIQHMKDKGIKFELCTETDAQNFLENNCFYFRVAAYRQLYPKIEAGNQKGQYQNLDFAYLMELYRIDNKVRSAVMEMYLDIERSIKTRLINDATSNDREDGYNLVKSYLSSTDPYFHTLKLIHQHKSGEYSKELINKYYPYFPIWALVEVIPFGTLIHISQYYEQNYHHDIMPKNKFMNIIRDLRNASAHGNCLINNINKEMEASKQPDNEIVNFIKDLNLFSESSRRKHLRRSFVYNITVLLYVYKEMMSIESQKLKFNQLKELLDNDLMIHKEYFDSNSSIKSVYRFFSQIVDKLAKVE